MAAAIGARMSRQFLRAMNRLIGVAVFLAFLLAGLYAGYALWDNSRIYAAAEDVQHEMIRLKPRIARSAEAEPEVAEAEPEAEEADPAFADLVAVNPDVCAWVTMDNTHIDYPVLHGASNFAYISTDVYGNYALAGSIFLDSRCDAAFGSSYQLLYGHNMADGGMFGDINLYKGEAFFGKNRTGTLIVPNRAYALDTFACLLVDATNDVIFEPERWQEDIGELLEYARGHSLHVDVEAIDAMLEAQRESGLQLKILAMSTCSTEYTEARAIVLAAMRELEPAG